MSETQQVELPKMSMTLSHFAQSLEGKAVISSRQAFILQGDIWQGYNEAIAGPISEKVLSDEEILNILDIDGTRPKLLEERARRRNGRDLRKQAEKRENELKREQMELQSLQLQEIRNRLGTTTEMTEEQVRAQIAKLQAKLPQEAPPAVEAPEQDHEGDPQPNPVDETAVSQSASVACPRCGKPSPDGHKRPDRWLRGHNMACKRKHSK
jgi:DNA repair exonuclease SbcCD ATPase subunit